MKNLFFAIMALVAATFYNCSNKELPVTQNDESQAVKMDSKQIKKASMFYVDFIYNKGQGLSERNPGNIIIHCENNSPGWNSAVWEDQYGNYWSSVTYTHVDGTIHHHTEPITFRSVPHICNPKTNRVEETDAQLATMKIYNLLKSKKQSMQARNGGSISIVCEQVGQLGDNEDVIQTRTTIWMDEYGTYWSTWTWGGLVYSTFKLADQTLSGAYAAC